MMVLTSILFSLMDLFPHGVQICFIFFQDIVNIPPTVMQGEPRIIAAEYLLNGGYSLNVKILLQF